MCSDECLGKALCGSNVDETFSYSTPVVVRIRDRRLGLLRIAFSVLIFAWIGVYNIWWQRGYAKQGTLLGNSRVTFQAPTRSSTTGEPSCDPSEKGCEYEFGDPAQLAYCSESPLSYFGGRKFPCANLTSFDLVSGLGNGGEYFLATKQQGEYKYERPGRRRTRARTLPHFCYTETNGIYTNDTNCAKYVYATEPERFTMLFDHGFSAEGLRNISSSSRVMKGALRVSNRALCESTPDAPASNPYAAGTMRHPWSDATEYCLVNPNKTAKCEKFRKEDPGSLKSITRIECGYDVLTLRYILNAAPLGDPRLDEQVNAGKNKTHRDQGIVLDVRVIYSNIDQPGHGYGLPPSSTPYYQLEFRTFSNQSAKWTTSSDELLALAEGSSTVLLPVKYTKANAGIDLHVRFVDDKVLQFDPTTLLSTLTSAITLIFVATKIVDLYMLSPLSKFRNYYRNLKFQDSINFTKLAEFLETTEAGEAPELSPDHLRGSLDEDELAKVTGLSNRSITGESTGSQRHRAYETERLAEPNVSLFRWRIRPDGQREFVQIEIPERVLEEHGREMGAKPKAVPAGKKNMVARQERRTKLEEKRRTKQGKEEEV